MACLKNQNYKSAVRTYNNVPQVFTDAGTELTLLGNTCTNTGCSLTPSSASVIVNTRGLYHFSADVTFTADGAGVAIVQLYNGTVALPCAISQQTVAAAGVNTAHVETDLYLCPCTNITPSINVIIGGVDGTVNWVGMSAVKLA